MRDLRSDPDWPTRVAQGLPEEIADDVPLDLFGLITALPAGATELAWDGPRVRVVEHPAHAVGHAALLVEDFGVLIAGDMLSDLFIPMLGDADDPVEDYLAGLRVLDDVASGVAVVVPGHGCVGVGDQVWARIEQDRAYLYALREGRNPDDPRITSPRPGWEWVSDIHEGQLRSLARRPG
jgi:glyoxylase-like metal-dependent hydrolase (beta-lactamase superfamily II)